MKKRKYKISDKVIVLDRNKDGPVIWVGKVLSYHEDGDYQVLDLNDGMIGSCGEELLRPLTKLHKVLM